MKRFFTLMKNELKLNIRDMNMVIFALIMPLAVFIVLGLIYRSKPAYEGADYTFLEQSFGAVCAVSLITLAIAAYISGADFGGSLIKFLGSWALTAVSTLSIGMMVGGLAKNSKQAGVIASVLYFPALLFSGTTVPFEIMPGIMQKLVGLFPLTQGIGLMKSTFLAISSENTAAAILTMLLTTAVCTGISVKFFKWE